MEKNNRYKILIIGTGDLCNYGCEAIIHGTYTILNHTIGNCDFYIASDDYNYDKSVLPADVCLIPYKQRFTISRLWHGFLRRIFHIGNGSPVRMNKKIGRNYDIVLSCGGDNYCEAPNGSLYNILTDLMAIGKNASKSHRMFVLWGASVGPFSKPNEKRIIDNLTEASLICVRETLSYNYLKSFELGEKLQLVADPAFLMEPDKSVRLSKNKNCVYIGLNISSLSIGHTITGDKEKLMFSTKLFEHLDQILENHHNWHFICVPHVVIPDDTAQNDYLFLQQFITMTKHEEQVSILPPNIGAKTTKGYISQLDILIAARMHCCIAGISTAVPTLFITYSNKGIGMSQYAYGRHDFDIPVTSLLSPDFENLIIQMVNKREQIREGLKGKQSQFTRDAMKAGECIQAILQP